MSGVTATNFLGAIWRDLFIEPEVGKLGSMLGSSIVSGILCLLSVKMDLGALSSFSLCVQKQRKIKSRG